MYQLSSLSRKEHQLDTPESTAAQHEDGAMEEDGYQLTQHHNKGTYFKSYPQ